MLNKRIAGSVKWALLGDLLPKILQPIFTLVLARLLLPEDFGIIAIATLVIGLARMIESMGLSQALIQTDENLESAANVVFWSNLALSGLLYIILFLTAPLLAGFFNEPRASATIKVMGLQLILSAFDDVQESLLQRNFQFKLLVKRRLLPALFSGLVSIPMAAAGFGYWSLIVGSLVGTAIGVGFLWKISEWRPMMHFNLRVARLMFSFGILVVIEGIQGWMLNYGDNLAAGYFLGIEDLGYYSLAFTLAVSALGYVISPLSKVAYAGFSRLKTEGEELQRAFIESTRILALIIFPLTFGLCLSTELIVPLLLGDKWLGTIPVIRILAIMPGLSWIISLNPSLYRAIGRPDVMPKFHIATLIFIIPAYIVGSQYGLVGFALTRASVGFVFLIPHIILTIKLLGLPRSYFWECIRTPFLATLLMSGVVFIIKNWLGRYQNHWLDLVNLVVIMFFGISSFILSIWFIDRSSYFRVIQIARRLL